VLVLDSPDTGRRSGWAARYGWRNTALTTTMTPNLNPFRTFVLSAPLNPVPGSEFGVRGFGLRR
jgi:hypothetical protein